MADDLLIEQASAIASMLPRLMRRFTTLSDGDPSMELPIAQLRLCSTLRGGSRTMSCLARELGISLSAVTQMADRLERSGLIERVPEADDRRVKSLRLTAHGEDLIRARREKRVARITETIERLSPESRQQVLDVLRLLLEAAPEVAQDDVPFAEPPVS